MTEILPCPFCGSTNLVGSLDGGICMDHEEFDAPAGVVATLYCDDCGCRLQAKVLPEEMPYENANELVAKKWNRRAAVAHEG